MCSAAFLARSKSSKRSSSTFTEAPPLGHNVRTFDKKTRCQRRKEDRANIAFFHFTRSRPEQNVAETKRTAGRRRRVRGEEEREMKRGKKEKKKKKEEKKDRRKGRNKLKEREIDEGGGGGGGGRCKQIKKRCGKKITNKQISPIQIKEEKIYINNAKSVFAFRLLRRHVHFTLLRCM